MRNRFDEQLYELNKKIIEMGAIRQQKHCMVSIQDASERCF